MSFCQNIRLGCCGCDCDKIQVSLEERLKARIEMLLSTLEKQENSMFHNGRKSLEEIKYQLDANLHRVTLGETLCLQVADLVDAVHNSCARLSKIFKNPEAAELVELVEAQITACLCVLRVICKVIAL